MKTTKTIYTSLATLGPLGSLPAPGTIGTIVTLPFIIIVSQQIVPPVIAIITITLCTILAWHIITRALTSFKQITDPQEIILDEVIGCLITFCGLTVSLKSMIIGFILFRFFDILKPLGIKKAELLIGATGILADDIIAGLTAHILLRLIITHIL